MKKALGRAEKAKEKVVVQVKKKAKEAKEAKAKTPEQLAAYQDDVKRFEAQVKRLVGKVEAAGNGLRAAERDRDEAAKRAKMYKPPLDRWGK